MKVFIGCEAGCSSQKIIDEKKHFYESLKSMFFYVFF